MNEKKHTSKKLWIIILILGILGQIAWGLENNWFNTYTYDIITTETWPIALMNGASAITATLTTFWMGTVSDRKGIRKPFIRYGYVLWGLSTAGFILSEYFPTALSRCIMVVVLDCIMTFFGSTAYDACFNAWTTDISDDTNRGMITVLIQLAPIAAQILLAAAGLIIDHFGYHVFFIATGFLVSVCGFVTGYFIRDSAELKPVNESSHIISDIVHCFSITSLQQNQNLFLVLGSICVLLCGFQVVYAYEMIYANNYLGIAKTWASLLSGAAVPVMVIGGIWAGKKVDQGKASLPLMIAPGMFAAGALIHAAAGNIIMVILGRALFYGGYIIMNIVSVALFKAFEPQNARGRFEGVRMVFMVLIPMVIGPSIGSMLIRSHGLTPLLYIVSGMVGLGSYLFVCLLKRQTKKALHA